MTVGYASNASRLPALLAAYRKYGSPAPGSCVRANQACSGGPRIESAVDGSAAQRTTSPSSHAAGWSPGTGTRVNERGKVTIAPPTSAGYAQVTRGGRPERVSRCATT